MQIYYIIFNLQNILFNFCDFLALFFDFRAGMAYIRGCNLKFFHICPFIKCRAATNGGNPAKFTRQKHRPRSKGAPFMRPATEKRPRKAKRNREFPKNYPKFPIFASSFTSYRFRYWTAAHGIRPVRGFSFPCSGPVGPPKGLGASIHTNASSREPNFALVRRILPRNRIERATSRPHILPRLRI